MSDFRSTEPPVSRDIALGPRRPAAGTHRDATPRTSRSTVAGRASLSALVLLLGAVAASPATAQHAPTSAGAEPSASRAPGGYSVIENKYRVDVRSSGCLRTFSTGPTVAVGDCQAQGGPADYTSMRMWKAVPQPGGYIQLLSKYKGDAWEGQCLRTFSGNDTVATGHCEAEGGPSDYTSMRLWKVVPDSDGYAQLQNKYRNDARLGPCLRTAANSTAVIVGVCGARGVPSDYRSMRLWDSDLFTGTTR